MKFSALALGLFAGSGAAVFSGNLYVTIRDDGSCAGVFTDARDDMIGDLRCDEDLRLQPNGNQIATALMVCHGNGKQAELFVRPHDEMKFCRAGFCSCMNTRYQYTKRVHIDGAGDANQAVFSFNDGDSRACGF